MQAGRAISEKKTAVDMTIDETINKLKAFEKKVKTDLVRDLGRVIAQDTVSQIETRVRDQQKDCRGRSFGAYSTRPMLTSGETLKSRRVWQKLASSKSKRRALNWVTIKRGGKNIHLFELKGGYAELRKLEGFNNSKKSFEFTGEMWRKFGVISSTLAGNKVIFRLGGKTQAAQDKIDYNSEREGVEITCISDTETRYLQRRLNTILPGYLAEVGL